jgi:hypothetical protein
MSRLTTAMVVGAAIVAVTGAIAWFGLPRHESLPLAADSPADGTVGLSRMDDAAA